jgi:hypothetical protein
MRTVTLSILLFLSCSGGDVGNIPVVSHSKVDTLHKTWCCIIDTTYQHKDSIAWTTIPKDSIKWTTIPKDSIAWTTIPKDSIRWTTIPKDSIKWNITTKDSLQIIYIPLFTDKLIKQIQAAGKIEVIFTIRKQ